MSRNTEDCVLHLFLTLSVIRLKVSAGSYFESTEGEIEIWVSLRFNFCHERRDRSVTPLDFVFERIDKAKEVRD